MSDKALESLKERSTKAHSLLFAIPLIALMLAGLTGCDSGYWFNTETIDPDKVYHVGAKGNDVRVYEWTSPVDGNKYISVHSDDGGSWGFCKTCGK